MKWYYRLGIFVFCITPVSVCYAFVGSYRFFCLFLLPLCISFATSFFPSKWVWANTCSVLAVLLILYFTVSKYPMQSFFNAGTCGLSSCNTNRAGTIAYNAGGVMGGSGLSPRIPLCPLSDCFVAEKQYVVTASADVVNLTPNGFFRDASTGKADLSRPCPVDRFGNCDGVLCDCVGSTRPQDYERNRGMGILDTTTLSIYAKGLDDCWGSSGPSTVCAMCTNVWESLGRYNDQYMKPSPMTKECNNSQVGVAECFRCVGYVEGESWDSRAVNAEFAAFIMTLLFLGVPPIVVYALAYYDLQSPKREDEKVDDTNNDKPKEKSSSRRPRRSQTSSNRSFSEA